MRKIYRVLINFSMFYTTPVFLCNWSMLAAGTSARQHTELSPTATSPSSGWVKPPIYLATFDPSYHGATGVAVQQCQCEPCGPDATDTSSFLVGKKGIYRMLYRSSRSWSSSDVLRHSWSEALRPGPGEKRLPWWFLWWLGYTRISGFWKCPLFRGKIIH